MNKIVKCFNCGCEIDKMSFCDNFYYKNNYLIINKFNKTFYFVIKVSIYDSKCWLISIKQF